LCPPLSNATNTLKNKPPPTNLTLVASFTTLDDTQLHKFPKKWRKGETPMSTVLESASRQWPNSRSQPGLSGICHVKEAGKWDPIRISLLTITSIFPTLAPFVHGRRHF